MKDAARRVLLTAIAGLAAGCSANAGSPSIGEWGEVTSALVDGEVSNDGEHDAPTSSPRAAAADDADILVIYDGYDQPYRDDTPKAKSPLLYPLSLTLANGADFTRCAFDLQSANPADSICIPCARGEGTCIADLSKGIDDLVARRGGAKYKAIVFLDHGTHFVDTDQHCQMIGLDHSRQGTGNYDDLCSLLNDAVVDGGTVTFYGCSVGRDRSYMQGVADDTGCVVVASDDLVRFRYCGGRGPQGTFDCVAQPKAPSP
ncbi:MAG: hypothetical protein U0169_15830 [Polyangiaceae bacterium]